MHTTEETNGSVGLLNDTISWEKINVYKKYSFKCETRCGHDQRNTDIEMNAEGERSVFSGKSKQILNNRRFIARKFLYV